jgi:PST family polysaccharide transporter
MSLIKTTVLNGISVAVKICSAIVINKALALYVGPSGYSIFGQFQNILTVATSASGGVFLSGVTKETAENACNSELQHDVWATAFRSTLILTVITTLLLVVNINYLNSTFFSHSDILGAIYLLIFLLPFLAFNNLILSILNGKKQIILYVIVTIVGNLVFGVIGAILIFTYGLNGGLCALIISPLIVLSIFSMYIYKKKWFNYRHLLGPINNVVLNSLLRYSLMGITSAVAVPYTAILIRSYIEVKFGLESAGYWQGVQKISDIYLALLTSTLVLYYLPRIAEIRNIKELLAEIKKVYFLILPLAVATSLSIYLLRNIIIDHV